MSRYILKRLLMMIPVVIGVIVLVFTIMYFTPGDPAEIMLGESATPEQLAAKRAELGTDQPYLVQLGNYIKKLVLHGDLGTSYTTGQSVTSEIVAKFPTTFKLAFMSVVVAVFIGVTAGVISATKQYSIFDHVARVVALFGVSMPSFWLGLMSIIVFSVNLGWFPSSGFDKPIQWVLPSLTLGFASAGTIMRMTRSSMLEVIRQDYIRTARSKGQTEWVVITKHALKNALIPIITVAGIQFGGLLGGSVLTETIFSIPGIGTLMVTAIKQRNGPVVQGSVLFTAVVFSFINLAVDILYSFVDPRIRSQYKSKPKADKVPKAVKAGKAGEVSE